MTPERCSRRFRAALVPALVRALLAVGTGVSGTAPTRPATAQLTGELTAAQFGGTAPARPAVAQLMGELTAAQYGIAVNAGDFALLAPMATLPTLVGIENMNENVNAADDDPCEFKIVVLQALFQSDVQRGISAATEWLAPASTQTVRCKGAALTLLARNGGKAVTPVILGIAKNEPDLKLRARAIAALGTTSDETVIDPLRDFALNSQDNTIVEAALYALGQHTGPRAVTVLSEIAMSGRATVLRRIAISSIATRAGEPSVDALLKIYDADQSLEIRKTVIAGFAHRQERARRQQIARDCSWRRQHRTPQSRDQRHC